MKRGDSFRRIASFFGRTAGYEHARKINSCCAWGCNPEGASAHAPYAPERA
jgi:hypothetical protein